MQLRVANVSKLCMTLQFCKTYDIQQIQKTIFFRRSHENSKCKKWVRGVRSTASLFTAEGRTLVVIKHSFVKKDWVTEFHCRSDVKQTPAP